MRTPFLHKKKGSSLWYYRRRFPKDVAEAVGKAVHLQSLQTSIKRDAERMVRMVAVQFDLICEEARRACKLQQGIDSTMCGIDTGQVNNVASSAAAGAQNTPESILAKVPALTRRAAEWVVERQQLNPRDWQDEVSRWRVFYVSALTAPMPSPGPQTAIEAQAFINGIDLAVQGKPLPPDVLGAGACDVSHPTTNLGGAWEGLCARALELYRAKVSDARYKVAQRRLPDVKVLSTSEQDVEAGLYEWCMERLRDVAPRTVKTQLDCLVSALRCVLPKLQTPQPRELKGVMQARIDDRQAMPIQAIREAIDGFKSRPPSVKARKGYGGGASQFDAIAVETLAVLGMRPRELMQSKSDAICEKTDVFGGKGIYFRIFKGKNNAAERDIPIGDGERNVLDIEKLKAMLLWQENNPRSPHGAVTSLATRFKEITKEYHPYQMRHSWADIARSCNVNFEIRERLMGHRVRGVATIYGSGVPLSVGLDAIEAVRSVIFGSGKETDHGS